MKAIASDCVLRNYSIIKLSYDKSIVYTEVLSLSTH